MSEPALDMSKLFTRSLMGTQPIAKWKSSPSFGFGSGTRDQRELVFISRAHSKGIFGRNSPGPANYPAFATTGPQVLSTMQTQPRWAFGTCQRFPRSKYSSGPGPAAYSHHPALGRQITSKFTTQPIFGFGTGQQRANWKVFISQEHNLAFYGRASPGPLAYGLGSTMGKQALSTMRSTPSLSFGSGDRSGQYTPLKSSSPGPAAYGLDASIGKQILSTMRSSSRMAFGKGPQMHNHKLYINEEINKAFYGREGPGPSTAQQTPGFYRQPLSRHRTAPQFGFSQVRAERKRARARPASERARGRASELTRGAPRARLPRALRRRPRASPSRSSRCGPGRARTRASRMLFFCRSWAMRGPRSRRVARSSTSQWRARLMAAAQTPTMRRTWWGAEPTGRGAAPRGARLYCILQPWMLRMSWASDCYCHCFAIGRRRRRRPARESAI